MATFPFSDLLADITSGKAIKTQQTGSNESLKTYTEDWDGIKVGNAENIVISNLSKITKGIMLKIKDNGGQDLTVTFKMYDGTDYCDWYDGNGNLVTLTHLANQDRIYGPISGGLLSFEQIQIYIEAGSAPTDGTTTELELRGVL